MKIKAAVLYNHNAELPYAVSRPLHIEEVDLDGPGEGEVLVRIAAAGLCHSDLSMITGKRPRRLPIVPGHEASGIVIDVGSGVNGVRIGDHVVMVFVGACGKCNWCVQGRPNLCRLSLEDRLAGTLRGGVHRLHRHGVDLNHASGVSAFAEMAVVSASSVVVIDCDVPLEYAALLGCAVISGVGAVVNTARVRPGASVAVVGLGGVGLSSVMGAALAGAEEIIGIDLQPGKLSLATELGATQTYNAADERCVDEVLEGNGGGVEYVFETAGTSGTLKIAAGITVRGGVLTVVGLPEPGVHPPLDVARIVADELVIRGSYMGGCIPNRDIPSLLRLHSKGRLPIERLLSGRYPLREINERFDMLASGSTVRELVIPEMR